MANSKDNLCIEQNCDICENIKSQNTTLSLGKFDAIPKEAKQTEIYDEHFVDLEENIDYENEVFEDDDDDDDGGDEDDYRNDTEDISLDLRSEMSDSQKSNISLSRLPRPINKTFSSERLREIEHRNMLLMRKILSNSKRANQYNNAIDYSKQPKQITSAAINRRKFQEKVFQDNQLLLKKIQSVKSCVNR